MSSKRKMVTLVHGTWARDAEWTQEGGTLDKALKENGYQVERIRWASWNRYTARRDGGTVLRTHLGKNQEFDHIIIAHSHGGNVALGAVDGDDSMIKGLVCLNTPFLNVLGRDAGIFPGIGLPILVAASFIPIGMGLRDGFGWSLALIYLAVSIAGAVAAFLFNRLHRYILSRAVKFHFKPLEKTPVYCLNTPDDEAFGVLSFLASTQNFLFLTMSRGAASSKLVGIIVGFLLLFEGLPFLYLPWDLWTGQALYIRDLYETLKTSAAPGDLLGELLVLGQCGLLYLVSALYYFGLYPLAVLIVLMFFSVLVTFSQGFFAPLSGLFNRFLVTLTPLNGVNTKFAEFQGDATRMRHSSLYHDKPTIDGILDWIESL